MLPGQDGNQRAHTFLGADAVTPEAVAIAVVNAMREEHFRRGSGGRAEHDE